MNKFPWLYEINTRVFLRRFDTPAAQATLKTVPLTYWQNLADKGITMIWLMGIWRTSPETISSCCLQSGLIQSYDKALRDWVREDIIGSPYSIDCYEVNPDLGGEDELRQLRQQLSGLGIKLVLDFIPNHFSVYSRVLRDHPEYFLSCQAEHFHQDQHSFFISPFDVHRFFAHGRDPFFPAWTDTVQINYFEPAARTFMIKQLERISELCDGVRCDMAMLILNNVFQNTWSGLLYQQGYQRPEQDFWQIACAKLKAQKPDFLFIAEAYWDLEWEIQQMGVDYTYDKRLYDRLRNNNATSIKGHLRADQRYQEQSVRFIENHDEERAVLVFGKDKQLAAAALILGIPGLKLFHDGQLEGKRIKLPVQLGREPKEPVQPQLAEGYEKLLAITKHPICTSGEWDYIETLPSWDTNSSYNSIIAFQWSLADERMLFVINYSSNLSQCRIKLPLEGYEEQFNLEDQWGGKKYPRSSEEVQHIGLYIELAPWQFHIFRY